MSENSQVLRSAIAKGKFNDFFMGLNGYQNTDRFNPSPILYSKNLDALYDLVAEDNELTSVAEFEKFLFTISNNVEGIFIATNYIYVLVYDINENKCTIPINIVKILDMIDQAIQNNETQLRETTELKRLSIKGNVFSKIVRLSQNCYNDNGIRIVKSLDYEENTVVTPSKYISKKIAESILQGIKIPHSISQPVIFKEKGKYFLSVFVFYFNREDIEAGAVDRPTLWALADIETGEILERRETKEFEFSDASYDVKYNVRAERKYDTSKEYYERTFEILDSVRSKLASNDILDLEEYQTYLDRIIANIPKAYQRFYLDLSV